MMEKRIYACQAGSSGSAPLVIKPRFYTVKELREVVSRLPDDESKWELFPYDEAVDFGPPAPPPADETDRIIQELQRTEGGLSGQWEPAIDSWDEARLYDAIYLSHLWNVIAELERCRQQRPADFPRMMMWAMCEGWKYSKVIGMHLRTLAHEAHPEKFLHPGFREAHQSHCCDPDCGGCA